MKRIITSVVLSIVLVGSLTLNAQTPVSGGIYSNTTWTLANSPYVVTDTVVVFPGVTLTIQPGVVVKFNDNMQLEVRQAHLIAQGTNANSITFTSSSSSPVPGIWGNIYMNYSSNSIFCYCNFYYAQHTIVKDGSDLLLIRHSNFSNNYSATSTNASIISIDNFFLDSCSFTNNTIGVCDYISPNNNIELVGSKINYCNISMNQQIGVILGGGCKMTNCTINSNQKGILTTSSNSGILIRNCKIDSNNLFGLYVIAASRDTINYCEIKYNGTGLYMDAYIGMPSNTITQNLVENNSIGIKCNNTQYNNIYCNRICNNSSYDFYYDETVNGSIPYNYWCSTDSTIIASHIYDGYDNLSLGLINFMPIDTSQCYLNGCNLILTATVTNATCDTCHNGSATGHIANGFPPYTWTWYTSPLQTTQTATGMAPGMYTLCVTDGHGCTACNSSIYIDSSNCTGFSITAHDSNATCSTCNDGKAWVVIQGGTPPYTFTWYTLPMQNTPTVNNLGQGNYAVCVTDLYGCVACDSVHIGVGSCSAYFYLYADTAIQHHYFAVNMASGVPPLSYLWNWGDGNTSTGPYPSHTYATAGSYTICLTITDFVGCIDTHCVSFYLQKDGLSTVQVDVISAITGISENHDKNDFLLYPNPANDNLTIEIPHSCKNGIISIYNIQGQLLLQQPIKQAKEEINISSLAKGIYIIKVNSNEGIAVKKFIKE